MQFQCPKSEKKKKLNIDKSFEQKSMIGTGMVRPTKVTLLQNKHTAVVFLAVRRCLSRTISTTQTQRLKLQLFVIFGPNHLNFSSNINSTDIKDCPMYVSYCFELEMPVNTHSGKPAATVSPILLQVNEP